MKIRFDRFISVHPHSTFDTGEYCIFDLTAIEIVELIACNINCSTAQEDVFDNGSETEITEDQVSSMVLNILLS